MSQRLQIRVLNAEFVSSAPRVDLLPEEGVPEIAFAGRSNAGKSSLLNALTNRRNLARTGAEPGKTRLLQLFRVRIKVAKEGVEEERRVCFLDLPGYGYAKRSKQERKGWQELVEKYFEKRSNLLAAVLVMDMRRNIEEEEKQFLSFAEALDVPSVLTLNKVDKIKPSHRFREQARLRKQSKGTGVSSLLLTSASSGEGVTDLWRTIYTMVATQLESPPAP